MGMREYQERNPHRFQCQVSQTPPDPELESMRAELESIKAKLDAMTADHVAQQEINVPSLQEILPNHTEVNIIEDEAVISLEGKEHLDDQIDEPEEESPKENPKEDEIEEEPEVVVHRSYTLF